MDGLAKLVRGRNSKSHGECLKQGKKKGYEGILLQAILKQLATGKRKGEKCAEIDKRIFLTSLTIKKYFRGAKESSSECFEKV